ncbi:MAG: TRAP transporter small permease [Planctomycetes bacterium]|nr:TRAP transporter small permease [Planctomycetota bacterium]
MKDAPASPPALPARAPRILGPLLRLDRRLQRLEVGLCAASLLVMIGLAFAQVLLRTFRTDFLQPVGWFNIVAQHLVIWVGMLGASLATAEGRHISVEALPKLLGPGGRRRNEVLVSVASLAVVGVLFALSMIYMVRVQVPDVAHLFRVEALGLNVPRWPFLVVVPFGLGVIGWRFGLRAAQACWMTDEEYRAREEALEREVLAASEAAEASEATDAAAPAEAPPEVPAPAPSPREPPPRAAPAPVPDAPPSAAAPPPRDPFARPGLGRSTDEIPVYRDIADDDDRSEPSGRHAIAESSESLEAIRPVLESSDVLDPPSDLGGDDLVEDAVERLADTERLKIARDPGPSDEAEPLETDRLPRPDLPGEAPRADQDEPGRTA